MSDCGIDETKFFGSSVSIGGSSLPPEGQPPPLIKIKENIEEAGCSGGGSRIINIDISGELVCCDPSGNIEAADSLQEMFESDCMDFSAGGYSFENARVNSLEIASSTFIGKVPYSASLTWTDPDYGDGSVTQPSNSVQSVQNDDTVTITHTVSATGGPNKEDCDECGCNMSDVEDFVDGLISDDDSPPSPKTFSIPKNPNTSGTDCPTVTEKKDEESCFYSITKVWTIRRNLDLNASSYGDDIKVTKCTETSEDENGKETIKISGSISFDGSIACDVDCQASLKKVEDALEAEKNIALSSISGREANVSFSFSEGSSPSGNYTVTFPPEPDDSGDDTKDSASISVSFSNDGIGTVTVSGSLTANQQKLKTVSENCLCEVVDAAFKGEAGAKALAVEYYDTIKGNITDALKKIKGPCFAQSQLGNAPETEDVGECEGGSLSYSYTWTDKEEKDAQWNYNVNVSRPIEKASIQNTIGGGYCVTRSGQYSDGSVSVSGSRSQNCPDDPDFNTDAIALELAQKYSGSNNLKPQDSCTKTVVGKQEENTFDKSFKFEHNAGGGGLGRAAPVNFNLRQAGGNFK